MKLIIIAGITAAVVRAVIFFRSSPTPDFDRWAGGAEKRRLRLAEIERAMAPYRASL